MRHFSFFWDGPGARFPVVLGASIVVGLQVVWVPSFSFLDDDVVAGLSSVQHNGEHGAHEHDGGDENDNVDGNAGLGGTRRRVVVVWQNGGGGSGFGRG